MDPLASAADRIFTHPHFGVSVDFIRLGEVEGVSVRILLRQPDTVANFGDTQIITETTMIEVRTSEVSARPEQGDRFVLASGVVLEVMGGARRDGARLTWLCEAREVSP